MRKPSDARVSMSAKGGAIRLSLVMVKSIFLSLLRMDEKSRASEFNLLELNNQSRRPHHSPRKTRLRWRKHALIKLS